MGIRSLSPGSMDSDRLTLTRNEEVDQLNARVLSELRRRCRHETHLPRPLVVTHEWYQDASSISSVLASRRLSFHLTCSPPSSKLVKNIGKRLRIRHPSCN
eukprot:1231113-Pleurochrysis_carterae.AAC.4